MVTVTGGGVGVGGWLGVGVEGTCGRPGLVLWTPTADSELERKGGAEDSADGPGEGWLVGEASGDAEGEDDGKGRDPLGNGPVFLYPAVCPEAWSEAPKGLTSV